MACRCFIVYPLPSVADESFLNVIFDGSVSRSVFAGFGQGRFAVVELQDEAHASAVRRSIGLMPLTPQANVMGNNNTDNSDNNSSDNNNNNISIDVVVNCGAAQGKDSSTPAELFKLRGATFLKNSDNDNKDCSCVSSHSGIAHIGRMRFRNTLLQVVPSPVALEEVYSCGGLLPERRAACIQGGAVRARETWSKENTVLRKRRRHTQVDEVASSYCEKTVKTHVRERKMQGSAASPQANGACRRCGSTEHFTRQCTVELAGGDYNNAGDGAEPKRVLPADSCKKCGSSGHFTRHCYATTEQPGEYERTREPHSLAAVGSSDNGDDVTVSFTVVGGQQNETDDTTQQDAVGSFSEPRQEFLKRKKQQQSLQRSDAVHISKDQCKHCGSDLHFSRHCPLK